MRQAFEVEDLEPLKAELVSLRAELKRIIEVWDPLKVEDLEQREAELEKLGAKLEQLGIELDQLLGHDGKPAYYEVRPVYEARPTFPGQRRHTAEGPK